MTRPRRLLTSRALALAAATSASPAVAFLPDTTLAGSGIDRIPVGDRDTAGASGLAIMPDGRTVMTGYAKQGDRTLGGDHPPAALR